MRQSILVIAVFSLFSSNALAQAPGNNFDCTASVAQTLPADRLGNARKCYQQGLELVESSQLTQAVEKFRLALQLDPEFADAYSALGRTYFKLREWQMAIVNLNHAASLNSKQREANEAALKKGPATAPQIPPGVEPKQQPPAAKVQDPVQSTKTEVDASKLKAAKEEAKSVAVPTPPASKDADVPDQAAAGARISMNATPPPAPNEAASPAASTVHRPGELPLTKIYRVGPNDVLDVRLNASDQQSTLYTITATGLLEHPLLTEPMPVAGLTVEEIGTRIEEDLRKRAIVEDPKAVVGIRDYASHSVLVSGLVKDAGTKFIRREAIPLYVVVADAQPVPEAARVTVVRNESNQIYEMDLNEAADMNFLVKSGDVVTLSPNTTQFVYIAGEIKFPGEKTFRRGLTLMQLILAAGGVSPKAKVAEIARNNENGFLVPTSYKLKEIASGKVVDPVLKPGDRISISR